MTKLHTHNAPDISVVKPHFLFGAVAFLTAVVLMIAGRTHLLGPYYDNKILAVVHVNLLGWAMMLIYGSLYQLVPVVFESKLYSEPLAKATFWLTALSVGLMGYAFWTGQLETTLLWAASFMYVSLFMFVFNIAMSYREAQLKNIKSYFIIAAIFWLFMTQTEGLLMAFNFKYNYYEAGNLYHLKLHVLMGLVGFFLQMIFGVGTTLVPMFLVSHKHSEKPLWPSFLLLNGGVALMVASWIWFPSRAAVVLGSAMITAGIGFYLKFVWDAYRNRFKRILDEGMQPTMLMFVLLLVPVILAWALLLQENPYGSLAMTLSLLLGFSMIFGVINMIILGQTYKTIPFIIWLERYQSYVGKYKIPLPKEVYDARLALWQYRLYALFLLLYVLAVILKNNVILMAGLAVLAVVAVAYNFNMLKMFFHKPVLEPLNKNK
ncbi:MAG: hypothetical protein GXO24_03525 [Chlorobi bacterium]|nr:hypothetical protein [Chlorobiota bacterium]